MPMGILFWVLWVICLLFGGLTWWAPDRLGRVGPGGASLIMLALFGLLGWHTFGPILR